jgi:hypothetical protein
VSDYAKIRCQGSAGYRRIELMTRPGKRGEFRCLGCNSLLEVFDGSHEVAIRLTVQPATRNKDGGNRLSHQRHKGGAKVAGRAKTSKVRA